MKSIKFNSAGRALPSEARLVMSLTVILERSLSLRDIHTELSLLCIWGYVHWQNNQNNPILQDEQHPDLGYVFREGISEMPTEIRQCFTDSALPDMCSPALFSQIINALNEHPARDAKSLIMWLHADREKSSKRMAFGFSSQLSKLLAKMSPPTSQSALLLFPEAASVATYFDDIKTVEAVSSNIDVELVLAHFLGGASIDCKAVEDIAEDRSRKSDFVISAPPLGFKFVSNVNWPNRRSFLSTAIESAVHSFNDQAVILVAAGLLSERSISTSKMREKLVNDNLLDAVIALPRDSHLSTSIYTALIVLRKQRLPDEPVRFIDFSKLPLNDGAVNRIVTCLRDKTNDTVGTRASRSELALNGYQLSVAIYDKGSATAKLQSLPNTVPLRDMVDIFRSQSFKQVKDDESDKETLKFREAGISDIDDAGFLTEPSREIEIATDQLRQVDRQKLHTGDILLSVKGSVGRIALVAEDCEDDWLSGQIFMILRPKSGKVTSKYLFRFLKSELCQSYFNELAAGATIKSLRGETVENLPVPYDEKLVTQIAELDQTISARLESIKPLLSEMEAAESQINTLFDMD